MKIGIPKEIKDQEFRVGLTPAAAQSLVARGHSVTVETQAGVGAGFGDEAYEQAGATVVATAAAVYAQDLVVKVKEPLPAEYEFLRPDLTLFTYLHLAANRSLTEVLLQSGATCIAYETVELPNHALPLLLPMSAIAGRLATQFGAHYLTRQQGGRGVLLGGVPGVQAGNVVILGGGVVGAEAARMAVGLGAKVQIFDINVARLAELEGLFGSRVEYLYSLPQTIAEAVCRADLVIGAVLVPGRRPPCLVSKALVAQMKPGAVIIDVAVDQGGCIETIHATTHSQPTYEVAGVLHYGVANMPGAVPWTATQALVNATLPYVQKLAQAGLAALATYPDLGWGLNVQGGKLRHPAIAESFPDLPSQV